MNRSDNYAEWKRFHSEIQERQKKIDKIYKELGKEGKIFFKSQLGWNNGITISQGADHLRFTFELDKKHLNLNLEDLNAVKDYFGCSKVDVEIVPAGLAIIKLGEW